MKEKSYSNWQEARRFQGINLFLKGWTQAEVAEALGVTKVAVSQWVQKYKSQGKEALQSVPRIGAPRRLSQEKKFQIPELLYPGAEAWGFQGDVWTCARIGKVIERRFRVRYHKHHIAKIMLEIGWTSHKPRVKASQRDEKAIEKWKKHSWPSYKKSPKREKNSFSPR